MDTEIHSVRMRSWSWGRRRSISATSRQPVRRSDRCWRKRKAVHVPDRAGQLVVRAKVGRAAASGSVEVYEQAVHLYEERSAYNFEPFFGALDHQTLFELARVAQLLGRRGEMTAFLERAQRVGETRTLVST